MYKNKNEALTAVFSAVKGYYGQMYQGSDYGVPSIVPPEDGMDERISDGSGFVDLLVDDLAVNGEKIGLRARFCFWVVSIYGDDIIEKEFSVADQAAKFFLAESFRMRLAVLKPEPVMDSVKYPKINVNANWGYSVKERQDGLKMMLDDPDASPREKFLAAAILKSPDRY